MAVEPPSRLKIRSSRVLEDVSFDIRSTSFVIVAPACLHSLVSFHDGVKLSAAALIFGQFGRYIGHIRSYSGWFRDKQGGNVEGRICVTIALGSVI